MRRGTDFPFESPPRARAYGDPRRRPVKSMNLPSCSSVTKPAWHFILGRMDEATRYTLVLVIVGVLLLIGIPVSIVTWRKRKRDKLRRRGIKTYGH